MCCLQRELRLHGAVCATHVRDVVLNAKESETAELGYRNWPQRPYVSKARRTISISLNGLSSAVPAV